MVKISTFMTIQALCVVALVGMARAGNPRQEETRSPVPVPDPEPDDTETEECKFLRQRLEGPCQSKFAQINCGDLQEQWERLCVPVPKPAPTPCPVPSGPSASPKPTSQPFECVQTDVVLDFASKDEDANPKLVEGEVVEFEVALPENTNKDVPAVVTLIPSKGIALSTTSLMFNGPNDQARYTVMAKFNPADRFTTGRKVTVTAGLSYPSEPSCKLTSSSSLMMRVKTGRAYTGKAVGDPHMRTFDGKAFDLHQTGVFTFVEGKSFQLQGAIRPCGPTGRVGCVHGVAVQFGNSIVRLAVENRELVVVKGSSTLSDLTVERQKHNDKQYRVFIVSDPSSYVDVKMGRWAGTEYMDVTCRASASLVSGGVKGVLGNANGKPIDDERDTQKLVAAYIVNGANLFTCNEADCASMVKPLVESDKIELDVMPILHQGYDVVTDADIPQRASVLSLKRRLRGDEWMARQLEQSEEDVRALCEQVFQTVPYCSKYVKDLNLYKEQLCVQDTMAVGDLANIDETKVAYLQECRRGIDETLALDTTESAAQKVEASVVRADLAVADDAVCPSNCSNRGVCHVSGCVCDEGFSGMACEVDLGFSRR